jgi:hypothetical protein
MRLSRLAHPVLMGRHEHARVRVGHHAASVLGAALLALGLAMRRDATRPHG